MAKNETRTLFDPELVTELFNTVHGESALAKLCASKPIPFTGEKEFTFSMDKDIDIVAENGKKSEGGITVAPVVVIPVKFEYGARVSDEFLTASEERKVAILKNFMEGFGKKLAKGLDIAAMHGFNPRTNTASAVIGANHIDAKATQTVKYTASTADDNLDAAIALVEGAEREVNGIAISKTFASDMSKIKANGVTVYPEFRFGGCPANLNGTTMTSNITVSKGPETYPDHAIVGDFKNAFRWGYANDISFEVIKYGDPDNTDKDLKGYGQVYLRSEAYLGWAVLDDKSFARVVTTA